MIKKNIVLMKLIIGKKKKMKLNFQQTITIVFRIQLIKRSLRLFTMIIRKH